MKDIRTILLTTDFSETSKRAFPAALTMARQFGAKLLLAHVEVDRLPPLVIEYMAVGVDDILDRQRDLAGERLQELLEELTGGDAEVDAEVVVVLGTPHVEIVRLAEERDVDLIVMATHGRGFISHAILGSTAERVLRRAPCPLLIIRDPNPED
jgi:nucleotide-binding universal stress UspA family protein